MQEEFVEYRLLGPLDVRSNGGRPIALGGKKQRALVALLLLNANRVVSRDRLIDELWGERPPETAVAMVQVYVSRLRKVLPAGSLVTRDPGYALDVGADELDLLRFERLVADARTSDPAGAARLYRSALQLWNGSALAEFGAEPFARVERRRLEELRLVALEERVEADLTLGQHAELVGELDVLIAEHPHRERLCRQVMLALYRSGRQADALEAYRRARTALDELGIEPSAALRQLERQVLAQDPALDFVPARPLVKPGEHAALPAPLVPSSPFPFVGRSDELAALHVCLERAEGGEGSFVLLTGEPGAGKTRLVRELAHEAVASGVLVCYGASDASVKIPYQPVRDWFEFVLRVCDSDLLAAYVGDDVDMLARLAPAFATLIGAQAPQPGEDSTTDRYRLQATVSDFLRRLGGLRPLLLVAEDIHWADGETLALLARLARAVPDARVVVVATFRKPGEEIPPELTGTLADLSRLEGVARLALPGLSAEDVSAFVEGATGALASAELVAEIEELTDGTPLLLCELWRELVAGGALEVSDASVTLTRPLADLRGPERIGELVEHRVSQLSAETGAMIELAAVTGPRFELDVVAAAAELDLPALTIAVDQGARSGIIEEVPARVPTCRFTHELVRRAVYDRIPRVRLPELHLRVGEALEQRHADGARVLPELAHHFTLAAPLAGAERAVAYNLQAAEAALASVAYHEAAARLSTALELGIADPRERARVQIELADLLYVTGRPGDSEALFAAARDAATSLEERGFALHALVRSSNGRLHSDPTVGPAEMIPIAEEAIETFERLGDSLGLALAEHLLGEAFARQGRAEESLAALERAIAHAEAAGDEVERRRITGEVSRWLCDGPAPVGEAIDRFEKLRASTRDDPVLDACVRRNFAHVLAMAGRFAESREHLRASSAVLDEPGQTGIAIAPRYVAAEAKELAGDVAGAEQEFKTQFLSLRDARGEGSDARAMRVAAELALLYCDEGRWDEAEACLAYGQEVDQAEPALGKVYAVLRLAARARLAARQGWLAEGLDLARRAVDLAAQGPWRKTAEPRAWLALAEVQRVNGQTAEADTAVATALALYEQRGNVAAAARLR